MNRKLALSIAAALAAAPSAAAFSSLQPRSTLNNADVVSLQGRGVSGRRHSSPPTSRSSIGNRRTVLRYKDYRGIYDDAVGVEIERSSRPKPRLRQAGGIGDGTTTPYKNYHLSHYHASYYETLDVDSDRMGLLSLLDPPSAPLSRKQSTAASSSARSAQRASPITQLHTIQDYHQQVLHNQNDLCIIRFSAPWCQVCKSTQVSWERLAAKISKTNGAAPEDTNNHKRVKFLSVTLDGKNDATMALKDMLHIDRVPLGIVHAPTQGIYGQKIDLKRSNLSALKKQLEAYVSEDSMKEGTILSGLFP